MNNVLVQKEIAPEKSKLAKSDINLEDNSRNSRPLSRKAQEMKIFIENNPIPKEFLK